LALETTLAERFAIKFRANDEDGVPNLAATEPLMVPPGVFVPVSILSEEPPP